MPDDEFREALELYPVDDLPELIDDLCGFRWRGESLWRELLSRDPGYRTETDVLGALACVSDGVDDVLWKDALARADDAALAAYVSGSYWIGAPQKDGSLHYTPIHPSRAEATRLFCGKRESRVWRDAWRMASLVCPQARAGHGEDNVLPDWLIELTFEHAPYLPAALVSGKQVVCCLRENTWGSATPKCDHFLRLRVLLDEACSELDARDMLVSQPDMSLSEFRLVVADLLRGDKALVS